MTSLMRSARSRVRARRRADTSRDARRAEVHASQFPGGRVGPVPGFLVKLPQLWAGQSRQPCLAGEGVGFLVCESPVVDCVDQQRGALLGLFKVAGASVR
jgi:hypothetical protein